MERKPCTVVSSLVLIHLLSIACYGQDATPSAPQRESEQLRVNWIYGAYVSKDVPLVSLSGNQRLKLYAKQTFTSPGIYVKTALFSAGDHISDSPSEWDGKWGGYARRVASRHGQFVIQNSIAAAANGILGYEPRYDRCRCSRFWPRMGHAAVRNFITYDRSETKKRPQLGLYGAALAAGAISSTWKPDHQAWTEGYRGVITQASFGMVTNVLSEFAPEIIRLFRKPQPSPLPPTK